MLMRHRNSAGNKYFHLQCQQQRTAPTATTASMAPATTSHRQHDGTVPWNGMCAWPCFKHVQNNSTVTCYVLGVYISKLRHNSVLSLSWRTNLVMHRTVSMMSTGFILSTEFFFRNFMTAPNKCPSHSLLSGTVWKKLSFSLN